MIKNFETIELVLVAIIFIDLVGKLASHLILMSYHSKLDKEEGEGATSYIHAELIVQKNREYTISSFVVFIDVILTIVLIVEFIMYHVKFGNKSIDFMDIALLVMGRGYLKLPMTVCLYNHHNRLNMYKI